MSGQIKHGQCKKNRPVCRRARRLCVQRCAWTCVAWKHRIHVAHASTDVYTCACAHVYRHAQSSILSSGGLPARSLRPIVPFLNFCMDGISELMAFLKYWTHGISELLVCLDFELLAFLSLRPETDRREMRRTLRF